MLDSASCTTRFIVSINGESFRLKDKRKAGLLTVPTSKPVSIRRNGEGEIPLALPLIRPLQVGQFYFGDPSIGGQHSTGVDTSKYLTCQPSASTRISTEIIASTRTDPVAYTFTING